MTDERSDVVAIPVTGRATGTAPPAAPRPLVRHRFRTGRMAAVASALTFLIGAAFLLHAAAAPDPAPPPQPPPWAARALPAAAPHIPPLGFARPTRVSIARVGIHADVLALGPGPGDAVGAPDPDEALKAAWYDQGPAPGQAGPAVITGHVDSRRAPDDRAAFYALGAVRPGDAVEVLRADRRTAVFTVDAVALVPKDRFPTRAVHGPTGYAALRLITCGGRYDQRGGYSDNIIVYAHLVGAR